MLDTLLDNHLLDCPSERITRITQPSGRIHPVRFSIHSDDVSRVRRIQQRLPSVWLLTTAFVTFGLLLNLRLDMVDVARAQPPRGLSEESSGHRWAVLIGVNDYAELNDLQFCKNDATALAEQLVRAGFPRDNVYLLCDGAGDAKDLPTKVNIERRIKNVLTVADKRDLVLVSFSGHGVHLNGKTYLCPTGARVDEPAGTMVPLLDVYGNLDRSRATRKLLWVDACRNDPRPSGMKSAASHARSVSGLMDTLRTSPEGIVTLASCAAGQISWEDEKFGHGVFMQHLLDGLSGKADTEESGNRNGRVSWWELFAYASINTKRFVLREKDQLQTPEFFGRGTGDFDIISSDHEKLPPETTNSIGMKLKLIPAGEFLMGSAKSPQELVSMFGLDEEDVKHFADEQPQHRVRITKPFYLGVTEVTQGQWDAAMGTRPWRGRTDGKEGSEYAATSVTWEDAQAFCEALSRKESATYRLPTEAEWEYACRAGTTSVYYFGDDASRLEQYAWYLENAERVDEKYAHRVGQKKPNAFGLYDMHGNVWEWCADWYDSGYYANSKQSDPSGPSDGSYRVFRGGGWFDVAGYCRSAYRFRGEPAGRSILLGFRVARSPSGR